MVWEPFALAIVFGLLISAGIYFVFLWPQVAPDDDVDPAAADAEPTAAEAEPTVAEAAPAAADAEPAAAEAAPTVAEAANDPSPPVA